MYSRRNLRGTSTVSPSISVVEDKFRSGTLSFDLPTPSQYGVYHGDFHSDDGIESFTFC